MTCGHISGRPTAITRVGPGQASGGKPDPCETERASPRLQEKQPEEKNVDILGEEPKRGMEPSQIPGGPAEPFPRILP